MPLESPPQESPSVTKLKEYATAGYLFHGSTNSNIEKFEPRQTTDVIDPGHSFNSDTAVFASNNPAAAAIFSLVKLPDDIDPELRHYYWSVLQDKDTPIAMIPKSWKPYVINTKGVLYVLPTDTFTEREGWQAKSHVEVVPFDQVPITFADYEALGGQVIFKDDHELAI